MKLITCLLLSIAVLTGCSGGKEQILTPSNTSFDAQTSEAPATTTDKPAALLDIKKLVQATQELSDQAEEVAEILGKPVKTENGEWTLFGSGAKKPFVRHYYELAIGTVSVMYIEGAIAHITVEFTEELKYPGDETKAMERLGLVESDFYQKIAEEPAYSRFVLSSFYYADVLKGKPDKPNVIRGIKVVTDEVYE
ncbi:hypothetical protein [Brevibacillus borstelensis]|uniref:hypothetical protein n=1 Tax=Brevibacillus borstelensis TaxID=45462 RepID=UPI0030C053D7